MTKVERNGLAPVMTELCHRQLGPPVINFYVARASNAPAAIAHGRQCVVVAKELVHGVLSGQLPQREAVAVLAHAVLVARSGLSRQDLAIAFWSTPWQILCAAGRPLRGLLGLAWRVRPVVFVVAIWQCLTSGPQIIGPIAAAVLASILALTYVSPRCAIAWERHIVGIGDRELAGRGLGPAMADFLRRYPQTPLLVSRLQVLQPLEPQAPRLRLIGS